MQKFIRNSIIGLLALFTTLQPVAANAFFTPLAFSIIPPVQFPPSDFSITGARFNLLYGKHRDVYGLDIGALGNVTDQTFVGLGVAGVANVTRGTTHAIGLQAAGITNVNTNKTRVYGVQLAGLVNMNTAESMVAGIQVSALANIAEFTDIYGAQIGLYNRAKDVYGFQIGLVNVATNLHGVQIGLANINQKGLISVSPFLNIGF